MTSRKDQTWSTPSLDLEQKIGQMIMVRYPDQDILREMLRKGWAGAFYFPMHDMSASEVAGVLNDLQKEALVPALVAFGSACADCGTGLIRGDLMRVGASRSKELAYRLGLLETEEQRAYGFHIPGIPVLDINTNPANPIINTRAIGDDTALVVELGLEILRGIVDARGLTCAMHFPGHGATSHDSHIEVPVDDRPFADLWEEDLVPYRRGIAEGLINGVCTNHVHYPSLESGPAQPSTVSRKIVTGLLRERLGYDGLIMSDSLTMKPMKDAYGIEESAVLTVLAGHDIILQDYQSDPRQTHRALMHAVTTGRIPESLITAAADRILRHKKWMGLLDRPLADLDRIPGCVNTPEMGNIALALARESVTVLGNRALPWPVADGKRCVLLANGRGAVTDIDMGITFSPNAHRLHNAVCQYLPDVQTITLPEEPSADDIERAFRAAAQADGVIAGLFTKVLCYHEDSVGLPSAYGELIRRVTALECPVALLNFGNPYLMAELPETAVSLCTYDEECPESYRAAAEVLFGRIRPRGRLPVHVSSRYPRGHGLTT